MRRLPLLVVVLVMLLGTVADAVSSQDDCEYFEDRMDHWEMRMEQYGPGGECEDPNLYRTAHAVFIFWRNQYLDNNCYEMM